MTIEKGRVKKREFWFFLNFGYIKKKAGMKNICFFYKYLFLIFGYL